MSDFNDSLLVKNAFGQYHRCLDPFLPGEERLADVTISSETETRVKKWINRQKKLYYPLINTAGKRAACILAAVLLATSLVTVSADSFEKLIDHFTYRGSDIYFQKEGDWWLAETRVEPVRPSYMPKGFQLIRERQKENFYRCFYSGPDAEFYVYSQSGEQRSYAFLAEEDHKVIRLSKDQMAYYFEYPDSKELVFSDGTYLYRIHGTLSKRQLIKIAKSVLK